MTSKNPFDNPFDFTEAFQKYDPKAVAQQIQDAFKIDFDVIKTAQDKNMELLLATNQAFVASSQSMLERQAEMLQQAMTEATEAAEALASSGSPQEVAARQAELLQAAYEKALANSTEISEMAQETQQQIADKVNQRIAESLDEFKQAVDKIA
jgi:phasin family protein